MEWKIVARRGTKVSENRVSAMVRNKSRYRDDCSTAGGEDGAFTRPGWGDSSADRGVFASRLLYLATDVASTIANRSLTSTWKES